MLGDFYGLTAKPFQPAPDPAFYYASATHRKALSYLEYGLAQGEGFAVITGERGTGKSVLAAHLAGTVDPKRLTVAQIVPSQRETAQIALLAARSLGLDMAGDDEAAAFGVIEPFLHAEAQAGRCCLLIVDDAQNLSLAALEELQVLSDLRLGDDPLLQTLLFAEAEFRATLQGQSVLEPLRQRVVAALRLEPMEQSEIEPYLLHRLGKAGWQGNPRFDQRVFTELFAASGGVPGRINPIATRLLLLGAVERRTRIDAAMLQAVVEDMADETAFPQAVPASLPRAAPHPEPHIDPRLIESLLAERDAQIAELQQAIVELATQRDQAASEVLRPDIAAIQERCARTEAKLFEQERTLRQTLTTLIEWIEAENEPARAA
ncbi:MAG: general secretion pathway protein [Sphingomonadales bacterium 12-68-11]|nr:MAG: general secretion pathway protein [Sphingomonadales bacterium 12-68-11]